MLGEAIKGKCWRRRSLPCIGILLILLLSVLGAIWGLNGWLAAYQGAEKWTGQNGSSEETLAESSETHDSSREEDKNDIVILEEVRGIIQEHYPLEMPPGVMEALSIDEMLLALGDPYASYMTLQEFTNLMDVINMSFVGIGVALESHRDGMMVSKVYQESPAAEVGICPGDIIVGVDGVDFVGMSLGEALPLLKGKPGSWIELSYCRGTERLTAHIERRAVTLPQVEAEVFGSVGYITIASFGADVGQEFQKAVQTLRDQGAQSWIIDLRDNGGGLVESALAVLGFFIGDGDAVLWQTSKEKAMEKAVLQGVSVDEPLIILSNDMTASASEIVIGALKDYEKASVLGERTYGSGRFKQIFSLSNGDYFMMTISQFFTPKNRVPVDFVGLNPDIRLSEEDAEKAAMLLLKSSTVKDQEQRQSPGQDQMNDQGTVQTQGQTQDRPQDQTGYLKWKIGAQSFRVALEDWRKEENWRAGQALMDQCFGTTLMSVGSVQGWLPIGEEDLADRWRIYYPGYQLLGFRDIAQTGPTLIETPSLEGLESCLDHVELIDEDSGRRIEVQCTLKDQGLEICPQETLTSDEAYWLILENEEGQGSIGVLNGVRD